MAKSVFDKSLTGVFDAAGGMETFDRVSKRFHRKVEADPELNSLFPKNMQALEERLALFLGELTGGTPNYTATRGKNSLFCRHAHLPIGPLHGQHWLAHMAASLEEEGVDSDTRNKLLAHLTELAATLSDPLIDLYRMPLNDLRQRFKSEPGLASFFDRGRNLFCDAAIHWDVERMRLLLEFGADINVTDTGGHNPLYRVANGGGREEEGRAAVELLIAHGANVNQVTGVGHMTPLHMAARRGTVQIAEALLNAGANIEAGDKAGETPLRRAVNCAQEPMVRFLMSRGANPRSRDNKGITPIAAARTESIRNALS